MKYLRIFSLVTILRFVLILNIQAQEKFADIGLIPFQNMTDNDQYQIVTKTLTDLLQSKLVQCADKCIVINDEKYYKDNISLNKLCEQNYVDNIIYGTICDDRPRNRQKYTIFRYIIGNKESIEISSVYGEQVSDVYTISDELINKGVISLQTVTGFGQVTIINEGKISDYGIIIDGQVKPDNSKIITHVSTGIHNIDIFWKKNRIVKQVLKKNITIYDNQNHDIVIKNDEGIKACINAVLIEMNKSISDYLQIPISEGLVVSKSSTTVLHGVQIPLSHDYKKKSKNQKISVDIITEIDGNVILSMNDYNDAMSLYNAGDEVNLTVIRDGEIQKYSYILEPVTQNSAF